MFISALRAYLVDIGGTRSQVDLLQATSEESTQLQLIFSGLPSFWAPKNKAHLDSKREGRAQTGTSRGLGRPILLRHLAEAVLQGGSNQARAI